MGPPALAGVEPAIKIKNDINIIEPTLLFILLAATARFSIVDINIYSNCISGLGLIQGVNLVVVLSGLNLWMGKRVRLKKLIKDTLLLLLTVVF
jgi:hypothetical protein